VCKVTRNDSYGKCELTGNPIEPARLEAIPWTRFSAAAERQLEQQGLRKRARLGARETVTGNLQPDRPRKPGQPAEPEENREPA